MREQHESTDRTISMVALNHRFEKLTQGFPSENTAAKHSEYRIIKLYTSIYSDSVKFNCNTNHLHFIFFQGELKVQAKHLIKGADGVAKGRGEYTANERQNVKGITLEMTLLCYCCLSSSNLLESC